jgi:hypothetical protein
MTARMGVSVLSWPEFLRLGRTWRAIFGLILLVGPAAAQFPPPLPPPQVPNPNPSSSLVVPQPREVPVSPAAPRSSPDFPGVMRVPNDASVLGSDTIMAPEPRAHHAFVHHARHYARHGKRRLHPGP